MANARMTHTREQLNKSGAIIRYIKGPLNVNLYTHNLDVIDFSSIIALQFLDYYKYIHSIGKSP